MTSSRCPFGRCRSSVQLQLTSTRRRFQLGTLSSPTRSVRIRARPPRRIHGPSQLQISLGRCPTTSPAIRCTQTRSFGEPGGSGRSMSGSPERIRTRWRVRSPNGSPCTVARNTRAARGGRADSGEGIPGIILCGRSRCGLLSTYARKPRAPAAARKPAIRKPHAADRRHRPPEPLAAPRIS